MLAHIGFSVSPDVYLLCRGNFGRDSCGRNKCSLCDQGGAETVAYFLNTYTERDFGPRF